MPRTVTSTATTRQARVSADPRVVYTVSNPKRPAAVYTVLAHPPTPRPN